MMDGLEAQARDHDAAVWLATVQVFSHDRQRQNVAGVITFASVSTALPWQNGQVAGRVTGSAKAGSDTADL